MSLFSSGQAAPPELCMSLQISVAPGPQSQSFEEVRMADYLTSYRATGRRPDPFPQLPADARTRAMQGLPPLFVPAPFPDAGGASTSAAAPSSIFGVPQAGGVGGGGGVGAAAAVPPITDPARLPPLQSFVAPVAMAGGTPAEREAFVSISGASEYSHWSHEELRYHAYLRGARVPPPTTQFFPFGARPPVAQNPSTLQNPLAPPGGGLPVPENGDTFMSITARPEFAGHSVEELRISFLRTGAEHTSAQLFAAAGVPLPPSLQPTIHLQPTLSTSFSGGAQAQPIALTLTPAPPQPQSIFGAPAPQFAPTQAQPQGLFASAQTQTQQGQPQRPGLFSAPPVQPQPTQTQTWGTAPAPAPPAGGGFGFAGAPAQGGFSFSGGASAGGGALGGLGQQQQSQQGGAGFGGTPTGAGAGGASGGGTGFAFGVSGGRRF